MGWVLEMAAKCHAHWNVKIHRGMWTFEVGEKGGLFLGDIGGEVQKGKIEFRMWRKGKCRLALDVCVETASLL